ncbi:MAG: hypothetical protein QG597_3056, partial [Actinomycetota bacterium]|nr:hypothetical protein [Actinomycetota bacterium]
RAFCEALATHSHPGPERKPSEWITDQSWYLYPWRQDPTISSMLVTLDALHERLEPFADTSAHIWRRLCEPAPDEHPGAIWFLFLPLTGDSGKTGADRGFGEHLYVKMNSRGRPLTTFEVFKADFESMMRTADPTRYRHLVESMDGAWADILWKYERRFGGDYQTDEEFVRYLTFIIDICEWRDGQPERRWHDEAAGRLRSLEDRARLAFADSKNADHAARNRDFFFHAFDTWVDRDPGPELGLLFRTPDDGEGPLPLFTSTSDLFGACIANYGTAFPAQETLLLFGVLLLRQADQQIGVEDAARRLRSLRNISAANLDVKNVMSRYVTATTRLILDGRIDDLDGFNQDWVADEALKWATMAAHPEIIPAIHALEDNPLTRGRVAAFDLDPARLEQRAVAFTKITATDSDSHLVQLRDLLMAALITKGDYSRHARGGRRQLGSSRSDQSWTDLLTTGSRDELARMRSALTDLLDDVAARLSTGAPHPLAALDAIRSAWVADRESEKPPSFDWRYYLARYQGARSQAGIGFYDGHYEAEQGGFHLREFNILWGRSYTSYFANALLLAAWVDGELSDVAECPRWWHNYDSGLTLKESGIEIMCYEDALVIVTPPASARSGAQPAADRPPNKAADDDASDNPPPDSPLADAVSNVLAPFAGTELVDDVAAPSDENRDTTEAGKMFRVSVAQPDAGNPLVDAEDRVQLCIRLVRALAAAGL